MSAVALGKSLDGFATSQCFVAGTLVLTIDGNKPIEEIKAGDLVYSTDPETGESDYKEVVRAFRKESDVIIHIFVSREEIETTPQHPFWVEDEWVSAKDLREGDVLTLADGTAATITKTYGEQLAEPVIVYNFEVQDFHTYYVTDTGVLVHNASQNYDQQIVWGKQKIDARKDGEGYFGTRTKQSNPRVDNYELKINPNDESYYLPSSNGGFVQFENKVNNTVQDGKLIMNSKSYYYVDDMPGFAENGVLKQAYRQIDAANLAGYDVEWLVSDKKACNQLSNLFKRNNLNITVTYFPE